jgi:DNA-binding response OmpR family regulator
VRTVVSGTTKRAINTEWISWCARLSVRIVSRTSAREAISAARDSNAALLLVHCDLVDNDAELLGELLMQAQLGSPVLCVGSSAHKARFLSHGADAFVSDRADLGEILAHATRLLETARDGTSKSGVQRPARSVLSIGPMVIELTKRRVYVDNQVLKLRPAEFEVLVYLALNRHRTVSAPEIVKGALDTFGDGSSARNQLFELRRKLRAVGLADAIKTERGRGYRLAL